MVDSLIKCSQEWLLDCYQNLIPAPVPAGITQKNRTHPKIMRELIELKPK
jgi:hypothetical protein